MTLNSNEIQLGWAVVDANGEDLGTVVEVDDAHIKVKKSGLLGGAETLVPASAVSEVEPGHVELSIAKADLG